METRSFVGCGYYGLEGMAERVGFEPTPALWLPQLVETALPRMPKFPPSPRTIARYCTLAGKYSAPSKP
jgi:hypothetical protein